MYYSNEQVIRFLPHRSPFLFVDSIEDISRDGETLPQDHIFDPKEAVGTQVIGLYKTDPEHVIFGGHFPGNPILPGVVQVEIMAQVSGFVMTKIIKDPFNSKVEMALMSVERAKFRKPITPNMQLKIVCECIRNRGRIMEHDCKIFHEDVLMSQAVVMASVSF